MFSFFSTQTTQIESRFSSCLRLKPLSDLIELLRVQVDKLNSAKQGNDDDAKTADLKYDVLNQLLNSIDDYIKYYDNVPQEAQNDKLDMKCLLDAIKSAVNKIDVVKRNFLDLARGVSNNEMKAAGAGLASVATMGAWVVGAISGPLAFVATALIVDAGVRASNQEGPKTRSLAILIQIEDITDRILHEVDRELELSQNYIAMTMMK